MAQKVNYKKFKELKDFINNPPSLSEEKFIEELSNKFKELNDYLLVINLEEIIEYIQYFENNINKDPENYKDFLEKVNVKGKIQEAVFNVAIPTVHSLLDELIKIENNHE